MAVVIFDRPRRLTQCREADGFDVAQQHQPVDACLQALPADGVARACARLRPIRSGEVQQPNLVLDAPAIRAETVGARARVEPSFAIGCVVLDIAREAEAVARVVQGRAHQIRRQQLALALLRQPATDQRRAFVRQFDAQRLLDVEQAIHFGELVLVRVPRCLLRVIAVTR